MSKQTVLVSDEEELESVVDELKPGTKLLNGQYTIDRFLNNGGFGITYLATDSLNRTVVVKECFPNAFCRRSKTVVAARSRALQSELRSVVKLFVQEAHSLAKLVHPHIVAVHQVFEDNGTAYMAIDYVEGRDLLNLIEDKEQKLSPGEVMNITRKLLSAVAFIHDHDMLHRDISPDNILLNKKGDPVLIDFGAAREQASRKSRALTALRVVKDGYSPQEFYIAGSEQGPWSDLYALAASLYHLIVGEAPANGQSRLAALAESRPDPYLPLAGRIDGYPQAFLAAVDKALNTLPKNRLQSAEEWLATLDAPVAGAVAEVADLALATVKSVRSTSNVAQDPQNLSKADAAFTPITANQDHQPAGISRTKMLAAGAAFGLVAAGSWLMLSGEKTPSAPQPATTDAPPAAAAQVISKPDPTTAPVIAAAAPALSTEKAAAAPVPKAAPIATTQPAAEPAPAAADKEVTATASAPVTLATTQINFAAWDVHVPFVSSIRMVNADPAAVVVLVNSDADLATSGDWIRTGTAIVSVNEHPVSEGQTIAGLMLNSLHVDPDGYTRAGVLYRSDSNAAPQRGLLAAPVVRMVSLANGIDAEADFSDGKWQTTIKKVIAEQPDGLQTGDILHRDKGTDLAFDGPQSLETVIADLQSKKQPSTDVVVIRDSRLVTVKLALAAVAASK